MNLSQPELSLVIPCYNEQENLRALLAAIRAAADPLQLPYEVVITDDCSRDKSWEILKELAAEDPRVRAQRLARQLRGKRGQLGRNEGGAREIHRHAGRGFAE